jgi:hypothetical protein
MVEFASVMRDYSRSELCRSELCRPEASATIFCAALSASSTRPEIAAKNRAYVEAARNTTDMISSHIEAVRAAMKAVAHEGAPTSAHHAAMIDMRQAG